jgi:hypothetical protein
MLLSDLYVTSTKILEIIRKGSFDNDIVFILNLSKSIKDEIDILRNWAENCLRKRN